MKEARQFDTTVEDPAFVALQTVLEKTGNAYDKTAIRTLGLVRACILLVPLGGVRHRPVRFLGNSTRSGGLQGHSLEFLLEDGLDVLPFRLQKFMRMALS